MIERRSFLKHLGAGVWAAAAMHRLPAAEDARMPSTARDDFFTFVVLPDTQCYADTRVKHAGHLWGNGDLRRYFYDQTQWIKDQQKKLQIAMVFHLGDIVQTDYDEEWQIANKAFSTLDGVVPYSLCVGNHDMGYLANPKTPLNYTCGATRETLVNKYFPPSRFKGRPWYGGHFEDGNENHFLLFQAGGMKFIQLALEFKPRDKVLAWANEVLAAYPDRHASVTLHSYLRPSNIRETALGYGVQGNHGEAVWAKLISRHANIFLVMNGHYGGEGRLTSAGRQGNPVHQLLADYQAMHNGGSGFLRFMTFFPGRRRMDIKTYSPSLDQFLTEPTSQFSLAWPG